MNVIYRQQNSVVFIQYCSDYLRDHIGSYRYLPEFIDYMLAYSRDLLSDMSFVVIENNRCVGICFLPIENIEGTISISLAGGYTPAPITANHRIEKAVFQHIEQIAKSKNVQKILFLLDPLILEYREKYNHLKKYGYLDTSTTDTLINLKKDPECSEQNGLFKQLNSNAKRMVNKVTKDSHFEIVCFDSQNACYKAHESYRLMHGQCAGQTREKSTFDVQFDLLKKGYASLFALKYNNNYIGFNYFFHFQKTAIYASGADDPAYENSKIGIYHPIIWHAMCYYQERNKHFLQLSQPSNFHTVGGFDDYASPKQINIGLFKRSMGGVSTPMFRGIRYFDKALFLKDLNTFKEAYIHECF